MLLLLCCHFQPHTSYNLPSGINLALQLCPTLVVPTSVCCHREEEKQVAAAASPDVHTLLSAGPRSRQGASVGIPSARRKVANQREPRESLPSIVGSNRGHHDKDAAEGSHTHHLPGTALQVCSIPSLVLTHKIGDKLC